MVRDIRQNNKLIANANFNLKIKKIQEFGIVIAGVLKYKKNMLTVERPKKHPRWKRLCFEGLPQGRFWALDAAMMFLT